MTIQLQIGHTYRTRDGSAEHTIGEIEGNIATATASDRSWWADTGKKSREPFAENSGDLVVDVHATPTGPVRQTTVTRTEIVPGTYGEIVIEGFEASSFVRLGFRRSVLNHAELDQAAATLTQLANALRAISAEKGTDQ